MPAADLTVRLRFRTRTALRASGFSLPELGAAGTGYARFDVHPDRKRLVTEGCRFQESDITMMKTFALNVRLRRPLATRTRRVVNFLMIIRAGGPPRDPRPAAPAARVDRMIALRYE